MTDGDNNNAEKKDEDDSDSYFGTATGNPGRGSHEVRGQGGQVGEEQDQMNVVYNQIENEANIDAMIRKVHTERQNSKARSVSSRSRPGNSIGRSLSQQPQRIKRSTTPQSHPIEDDDSDSSDPPPPPYPTQEPLMEDKPVHYHNDLGTLFSLESETDQYGKRGTRLSTHRDTTPLAVDRLPSHAEHDTDYANAGKSRLRVFDDRRTEILDRNSLPMHQLADDYDYESVLE